MSNTLETPGTLTVKWTADDGREFYAEIEPTDKGLQIYFDGEGSVEVSFDVRQDSINYIEMEVVLNE